MNPQNGSQSGGVPNPPGSQDRQSATANVIRSQINALYGDEPVAAPRPQPTQQHNYVAYTAQNDEAENPYDRTHTPHPQPQAEQWKAYHSAWQDYYQKYYEGFYAQQQKQAETQRIQQEAAASATQRTNLFSSSNNEASSLENTTEQESRSQSSYINDTSTKDQALFELRQKLLGNVRKQAKKIRRSKHFMPIAAALVVVLVFVFIQYNRVFIATVNAYVSPGAIDPQNIVLDPGSSEQVGPDPRLIIPKINVDVPAIYGIGADYDSQMAAMQKGVAHFSISGANSRPGEMGNTVLSGHSSNDLFDPGDYKFIFAQLDRLTTGDTIYANYEGVRYTYVVTKKEVVKPTDVQALVYPTTKPVMTLITCTPLGTSQNRLLVTTEQVSPDPAAASAAPSSSDTGEKASIPGNSPTLLERLFGAR